MGNSQSNEEALKSPQAKSSPAPHQRLYAREHSSREKPTTTLKNRQSHASVKSAAASATSSPAPPTATLIPSPPTTASTSSTNTNVTATVSHSPSASAHSRAKSITHAAPTLRPEVSDSRSHTTEDANMGNTQSQSQSQRPSSRQSANQTPAADTPISSQVEKETSQVSPPSQPVDVPQPHDGPNEKDPFEPSGVPIGIGSPYSLASGPSRFDRPPRLPLPIEQEPHAPGSPIISPQDLQPPLEEVDVVGHLPRRASVLSSTTVDEDDVVDQDAFVTETQSSAFTVPVKVTWRGADFGDKKLYVTGTFVSWDRKYKMHRDKDSKGTPLGTFSTILQLQPGTHHLKFLVNSNDQILSDDLPTTVDYTNMLVNYIEVPSQQPAVTSTQVPAPAEPMPIPGAAMDTKHEAASPAKPLDIPTATHISDPTAHRPSTLEDVVSSDLKQSVSIPNRAAAPAQATPSTQSATPQHQQPPPAAPKQKVPRPKYTSAIPDFLVDLDRPNQEDEEYQRAKRIEPHLPAPPSLPMFLGKSILNGTTPHKDDASVLIMPNHTVLNHLATSSIKHGVLATSATTRYKRKFLTTIMYKPTSSDDS